MWKSACVGVYQLLSWKMHGETLKLSGVTYTTWVIIMYLYYLCFVEHSDNARKSDRNVSRSIQYVIKHILSACICFPM